MTDPAELRDYLHEHIPICRHLGVGVVEADSGGVRLRAPLQPNLNHRDTAFGGSISALAILAGWSLLWVRLRGRTGGHQIVIQHSDVTYTAPVDGDFDAVCAAPAPEAWERFVRTFERRGRARIALLSRVLVGEVEAAAFEGRYVALGPDR